MPNATAARPYFTADDCNLAEFTALISQTTRAADLAHVADVQKNIPTYDMAALRPLLADPTARNGLMAEWAHVMLHCAGVLVLKSAYAEPSAIDAATARYNAIIAAEKASGGGADHFAAAGSNDRVWNSLQKLCEADPATFIAYFSNPAIDAVSEAWLGPNYQMTAQVNLVHPGGAAQQAHRDYHLGFVTAEASAAYPAHAHDLSPVLTLQGAIAHCDMPVESGPTKLLPYSQLYRPGYAAWRRPDFRACFEERSVQLALKKGDALFFNPALFHAAGANSTADIHRMANLLQVSSAMGRALESIDRTRMCGLLYPHVQKAVQNGNLPPDRLAALLSATAEGYSFPTNLDRDPPVGGLAPETQKALFHRALAAGWTPEAFGAALAEQGAKQRA